MSPKIDAPPPDPLLALALATSLGECWCGDEADAIGIVRIEAGRIRLFGLCWVCACIVRMSPKARAPYFRVVA